MTGPEQQLTDLYHLRIGVWRSALGVCESMKFVIELSRAGDAQT
jgi:hypothetical protein